jgi:putative DNA primase/helicase
MFLIPFTYTIPKEKRKDKNQLLHEFSLEASGIFNWAMQGLLEYDKIGLAPPAAVLEATEEYKEDSNNFKSFIKERCTEKRGDTLTKITAKALFDFYSKWCIAENEHTIFNSSRSMISYLRQEGFRCESGAHNAIYVYGIEILAQNEENGP